MFIKQTQAKTHPVALSPKVPADLSVNTDLRV